MDLSTLLSLPAPSLTALLLVLVRMSGLVVTAPVLGATQVPARFRVGFAVLVTMLLAPLALQAPAPPIETPYDWTVAIAGELALGLLLGFVATLFLSGAQVAGHFLALQMGFSMNQLLDPVTRGTSTEIGVMMSWLATLSFLGTDSHHWLIAALWRTFKLYPPGRVSLVAPLLDKLLGLVTAMFEVSLSLMLPMAGLLLVVELALAILSRVVPQLNVFQLGSAIKIPLGVLTLILTLPLFGSTLDWTLQRFLKSWVSLF